MAIQFNVIGLVVSDMGRSLAFYRRLGLDLPAEADGEPHVEVTLPGGFRLCWDTEETIKSFDPEWTPGPGRTGLAFQCDNAAEVDTTYAEMAEFGHLPPWDAFWGQRYAVLTDPDGISVDLYAPLDPSA
ncbi:VOC family protein [Herbidospora sp. NBRC 101105]|uniref:VOC family protein n=1 Tax=Herbidospora sp. NBRC 101105 TaxID=3032195 RepID=UPI0024A4C942|nr:VOC family protein [Herbidospora sp. NBRC 101105]GLX94572.1 glyoxalase [Herbidospora sp. NBRC 101105]